MFAESEDKSEFLANIDQALRLLAKINVMPDIELLQEFIFRKIRNNQLTPDELELATRLADLIDIKIN